MKRKRNRQVRSDNVSGFAGVSYDPRYNYYQTQVCISSGNRTSLGTFDTPEEAALVVNEFYEKIGEKPPNQLTDEEIRHIKQRRVSKRADALKRLREKEMKVPKILGVKGEEYRIQQKIKKYLEHRGWFVKVLTGTMYQWGLSDLLACHKDYGIKLIEVKNPKRYSFTAAQIHEFPKFISHGAPIYILTGADAENYKRLFGPSNLWLYLSGIAEK